MGSLLKSGPPWVIANALPALLLSACSSAVPTAQTVTVTAPLTEQTEPAATAVSQPIARDRRPNTDCTVGSHGGLHCPVHSVL